MAAVVTYDVVPASPIRSNSNIALRHYQDSYFRSMTPSQNPSKSNNTPSYSYPLSRLYIKYIRRVWKRVSRATRKPERASVLPDGFVLINNARLNAAAKRKSVLFS